MQTLSIDQGDSDDTLGQLIQSNDKVVAMFSASWCGPCKRIYPVVKECANTHDDVLFCVVDVDEFQETAQQYGVQAMPTFVFFRGGVEQPQRLKGASKESLLESVKKLCANDVTSVLDKFAPAAQQ